VFGFLAPARDLSPLSSAQITSGTHPILKSVVILVLLLGEDNVTGTESNSVMAS
jgi:hypothetical protein